jgi:hypothetical protein
MLLRIAQDPTEKSQAQAKKATTRPRTKAKAKTTTSQPSNPAANPTSRRASLLALLRWKTNNKLQQNGFSMEDVKEDEPHIEMNLGLGVLKELNGKDGEEAADSSEEEEEDGDATASPERKRREKDIMGKLMGGRKNEAAGIEEIG